MMSVFKQELGGDSIDGVSERLKGRMCNKRECCNRSSAKTQARIEETKTHWVRHRGWGCTWYCHIHRTFLSPSATPETRLCQQAVHIDCWQQHEGSVRAIFCTMKASAKFLETIKGGKKNIQWEVVLHSSQNSRRCQNQYQKQIHWVRQTQ